MHVDLALLRFSLAHVASSLPPVVHCSLAELMPHLTASSACVAVTNVGEDALAAIGFIDYLPASGIPALSKADKDRLSSVADIWLAGPLLAIRLK